MLEFLASTATMIILAPVFWLVDKIIVQPVIWLLVVGHRPQLGGLHLADAFRDLFGR
jgi:hypothetical protein